MNYKGQRALVTGASSGIGAVFARELARRGADLVLVARSADKLAALADELSASFGVAADVAVADLAAPSAADGLAADLRSRDLQIDILVNNAGFGLFAQLDQADAAVLADMIRVNVAALVDLTRLYLPGMLDRDRGAVINVASTAAFQPVPYMAVYGATKAFVLSFTEALWAETRGTGVRVTAICPGSTETSFFDIAGENAQVGQRIPPQRVVHAALRAVDRRASTTVTGGAGNWLLTNAPRLAPRQFVARMAARTMRPAKSREHVSQKRGQHTGLQASPENTKQALRD
ncbi:SDR family NAD(P)-dependent oxidoreductase [Candidatus Mycolicibacterium alkanivorans]|uniref:SDR family oxidoreductase n=1 Tax=Candidatus Mycolicibacterium alkanivorans TaxID=2954114 RepID=A0ABS9YYK5_9MYCO|nr:SDR family oxidoreductase [Candidatus Mycolicibacterium alkanivorans]MCI4675889.1 SDR family oxidoreductase [Candidatus Mycolicibacterium alkanivorans]